MSYLSLLIALFMTQNVPEGTAWLDTYLDNLVVVETWFYKASWWVWGTILAVALVLWLLSILGRVFKIEGFSFLTGETGLGCGCAVLVMLFLPLLEWITLFLAKGMASAVNPSGIVDQGKFWVNLIIYILIGSG